MPKWDEIPETEEVAGVKWDEIEDEELEPGSYEAIQAATGGPKPELTAGDIGQQIVHTATGGADVLVGRALASGRPIDALPRGLPGTGSLPPVSKEAQQAEAGIVGEIGQTRKNYPTAATLASMTGGVLQGAATGAVGRVLPGVVGKVAGSAPVDFGVGVGSEATEALSEGATSREAALRAGVSALAGLGMGGGANIVARFAPGYKSVKMYDEILKGMAPDMQTFAKSEEGQQLLGMLSDKGVKPEDLFQKIQSSPQDATNLAATLRKEVASKIKRNLEDPRMTMEDQAQELSRRSLEIDEKVSETKQTYQQRLFKLQEQTKEQLDYLKRQGKANTVEGRKLQKSKQELKDQAERLGKVAADQNSVVKTIQKELKAAEAEATQQAPEQVAEIMRSGFLPRLKQLKSTYQPIVEDTIAKLDASNAPNTVFTEVDVKDLADQHTAIVKGLDTLGDNNLARELAEISKLSQTIGQMPTLAGAVRTLEDVKKRVNAIVADTTSGTPQRRYATEFRNSIMNKLYDEKISQVPGLGDMAVANQAYAEASRAEDYINDLLFRRVGREQELAPGKVESAIKTLPETTETMKGLVDTPTMNQWVADPSELQAIDTAAQTIRTGGQSVPTPLRQSLEEATAQEVEIRRSIEEAVSQGKGVTGQIRGRLDTQADIKDRIETLKQQAIDLKGGIVGEGKAAVRSLDVERKSVATQIRENQQKLKELQTILKKVETGKPLTEAEEVLAAGKNVKPEELRAAQTSQEAQMVGGTPEEQLRPFTSPNTMPSESVPQKQVTQTMDRLELKRKLADSLEPILAAKSRPDGRQVAGLSQIAEVAGVATAAVTNIGMLPFAVRREVANAIKRGEDPILQLTRLADAQRQAREKGYSAGSPEWKVFVGDFIRRALRRAASEGASEPVERMENP